MIPNEPTENPLPDQRTDTEISNEIIRRLKPIRSDPNEPYNIRYVNPRRSEDSQRMRDIDRHPLATQYMDPPRKLGNKEFDILVNADLSDTTEPVLLLAVTTKEDNEIVGWVSYYPDAPERIASLRKQKDFPPDSLVLEVSYSKLFSKWPPRTRFVNRRDNLVTEDNKGVAINGVKQTLLIITEMEDKISAQSGQPSRPLYVTAYTDPTNVASETVLKRNGFRLLPKQIKYEGELNRAWIKQAAVH